MLQHRNDENTVSGHSSVLLKSTKKSALGKTPLRQISAKSHHESNVKTGRRALGSISVNAGRQGGAGKSIKKKAPLSLRTSSTTHSSSNRSKSSTQQKSTTVVAEVECSSRTSESSKLRYDGGVNRVAALSALQMGVRATSSDTAAEERRDAKQCAAVGLGRGFAEFECDDVEITSLGGSTVAMVSSTISETVEKQQEMMMPSLGDLSFGDISSDSETDDDDDEE